MDVFIDCMADYYGEYTVDELAERLNLSTIELLEFVSDPIDENFDALAEEMEYNKETADEEED